MAKTNHRNKQRVPHQTKGRRPKKPETHTVNGHELTTEQFAEFTRRHSERLGAASTVTDSEARRARDGALEDVLYAARPTTKARGRFLGLGMTLSRAAMVIIEAKEYSFHNRDPKLIGFYNSIIGHAVDQAGAVVEELRKIHVDIAQEIAAEVSRG